MVFHNSYTITFTFYLLLDLSCSSCTVTGTVGCFYSLKDLDDFIQMADNGLNQPIKEGDYTGLVKVMGQVMAVKDRQTATDEMFEPLKQTIDLLKSYNQEMPEDVYLQLQVRKPLMHRSYFLRTRTV